VHRTTGRDATPLLVVALVVVLGLLLATPLLLGDAVPVAPGTSPGPATSPYVDSARLGPRAEEPSPAPSATPTASTRRSGPSPQREPTGPNGPTGPRDTGERECVDTGITADLTVLSYNIKSGQGAGTLPQIAELVRASGADVVLLQEVDQLRYSSGRVDMPGFFSAELAMPHVFAKNVFHADGGSYGTVILSRHPILSWENTYLPRPGATQQRGLLHAVLDVAGIETSVYNTHLQNADEPARLLQVAAINRLTGADPRPQVLGGDFNATPTSPPMAVLGSLWTDTWSAVGSGLGQTAPAGDPRARIDYLLHRGPGITPLATDVLTTYASDHRPVRAAYRLEAPGEVVCVPRLD
jgi:endonuclease/exonuclease/phosphatase family metal-dependent hydrolase